jgi:hypothetical protein
VSRATSEEVLPDDRRREIFKALVEAQDGGLGVGASRAETAKRFEVSVEQVQEIEAEGLENAWPPL